MDAKSEYSHSPDCRLLLHDKVVGSVVPREAVCVGWPSHPCPVTQTALTPVRLPYAAPSRSHGTARTAPSPLSTSTAYVVSSRGSSDHPVYRRDADRSAVALPQYANKQGKLEDAAPATSYETVPITGNIDRLRKFNVPHEQQDK